LQQVLSAKIFFGYFIKGQLLKRSGVRPHSAPGAGFRHQVATTLFVIFAMVVLF